MYWWLSTSLGQVHKIKHQFNLITTRGCLLPNTCNGKDQEAFVKILCPRCQGGRQDINPPWLTLFIFNLLSKTSFPHTKESVQQFWIWTNFQIIYQPKINRQKIANFNGHWSKISRAKLSKSEMWGFSASWDDDVIISFGCWELQNSEWSVVCLLRTERWPAVDTFIGVTVDLWVRGDYVITAQPLAHCMVRLAGGWQLAGWWGWGNSALPLCCHLDLLPFHLPSHAANQLTCTLCTQWLITHTHFKLKSSVICCDIEATLVGDLYRKNYRLKTDYFAISVKIFTHFYWYLWCIKSIKINIMDRRVINYYLFNLSKKKEKKKRRELYGIPFGREVHSKCST